MNFLPKLRWRWVAAILAAAGILLILAWRLRDLGPAPDIHFTSIEGKPGHLSAWRGHVVLVNFWATSCTTCVKEMPMLVETHRRFNAQGYETLAIAMAYDPPNYVLDFAKTRALPFVVSLDPQGKLAQAFGNVQLTPTSFLIDSKGRIVKRYVGEPAVGELQEAVANLLKKA